MPYVRKPFFDVTNVLPDSLTDSLVRAYQVLLSSKNVRNHGNPDGKFLSQIINIYLYICINTYAALSRVSPEGPGCRRLTASAENFRQNQCGSF